MKVRQQPFSSPHNRSPGSLINDSLPSQQAGSSKPDRFDVSERTTNSLDYLAAQKLLQYIGKPAIQMVLWDGSTVSPNIEKPVATLYFRDRASLYLSILRPELNLGDFYSQGRVEVEGDLVGFLEAVYRGLKRSGQKSGSDRLSASPGRRKIRNTFRRAADNIHHHYDIGNNFYRLWLDRDAMQYTCAYYPDPAMSLEEAQVAKMAHVCRKLRLKPGERVVEAGGGWGGLALYMARNHGVTVMSYNISREQVSYAREKARAEGLTNHVEYILDDYRNISGEFDVFVSVGMLEHVGTPYYPALGQVINNCLRTGGRGLIHSIGRNRPMPMNAWIERRIFPGAYPPSLGEMMGVFENNQLSVLDVENLRLHYARTLKAWLQRFEQNTERVEEMMDERFVRTWRLYLAGSQAAFTSGQLQLFQLVFAREEDNGIPWSRAHQYTRQEGPAGTDQAVADD